MQRQIATYILVLAFAALPQMPSALTEPSFGDQNQTHTSQSQVFVSSTTSLVRQGERHACVQSAGTNWKTQSTALTLREKTPVDLQNLQSNTPFVSLVRPKGQSDFLRIAMGFRIFATSPQFQISTNSLTAIDYEIEPRGDTLVIKEPNSLARILEVLRSEDGLRITAQSQKLVPTSSEHIVSHVFKLDRDEVGLRDCLDLAKKPASELGGDIQIGFGATARNDVTTAQAEAAACNRDLDPTNAELVAFSTLKGIALPLSHAFLRRDKNGKIDAIWAGDLLRIERKGSTYQRRISRSVQAQGPLDTQSIPACTRMAAPACVNIFENSQGRISIMPCISDMFALAANPTAGLEVAGLLLIYPASTGISSGGGFGGGGVSGSGSITSAAPVTTSVPSAADEPIEYVLANQDPQRVPTGNEAGIPETPTPSNPNVVPLPGGFWLLLLAMGLAFGTSRRVPA